MPGSYAGGYDYTTGFACGYSPFSPYRLIFVWIGNLIGKSQDEFICNFVSCNEFLLAGCNFCIIQAIPAKNRKIWLIFV